MLLSSTKQCPRYSTYSASFNQKNNFNYLFKFWLSQVLVLCCCVGLFLGSVSEGYSLVVLRGLLIAVASLDGL